LVVEVMGVRYLETEQASNHKNTEMNETAKQEVESTLNPKIGVLDESALADDEDAEEAPQQILDFGWYRKMEQIHPLANLERCCSMEAVALATFFAG
jgi:hypothetical protein